MLFLPLGVLDGCHNLVDLGAELLIVVRGEALHNYKIIGVIYY